MRYSKPAGFFLSGILAVLLSGCFNPITAVLPQSGDPLTDSTATIQGEANGEGIPDTGSFTVTIAVNPESGGGVDGRAATGLVDTTIKTGGVRNTYLLVVVDKDGNVAAFWEGNKGTVDDDDKTETVILPAGDGYKFLLLMGHRERNYAKEIGGNCVYKAGAPTLLAAGLTSGVSIDTSPKNVDITMKAVEVTAKFTSVTLGDVPADAAGVELGVAADWKLIWTLNSGENAGLEQLKSALAAQIPERDPSYLFRGVSGRAWENGGSYTSFSSDARFDFTAGTITLDLGEPPGGVPCAAWFNLEYAPFSLDKSKWDGETWVIRNGVNDLPQDGDTDFDPVYDTDKYKMKWDSAGGKNGNGALSFIMPATVITDLNLAPYLPAPVTGGTAGGSLVGKEYIGTVAWKVTAGGGLAVDHSGLFQAHRDYTATVTLYSLTGYTFAGVVADTFEHGNISTTHDPGDASNPLVVTITFPPTADLPTVTDLDLTLKVPAPVWGSAPVTYFAAPQYTGEVVWKETSGTSGPASNW